MPDLLIRDIDEKILEKLKTRAERNGRVLQSEIQVILIEAAEKFEISNDAEIACKIKDGLRGGQFSDSAELLGEDRNR